MLPINQCTQQVVSPHSLWAPKNLQTRHTIKAYCVQLWVSHLWCGKGTYQDS